MKISKVLEILDTIAVKKMFDLLQEFTKLQYFQNKSSQRYINHIKKLQRLYLEIHLVRDRLDARWHIMVPSLNAIRDCLFPNIVSKPLPEQEIVH